MIFVMILGIAVIALGIYALKHSKRMNKLGRTQARVENCQPSSMEILSKQIPCYEVTFEIYTPHGVVYKSMKDSENYEIGQEIEVFYDAQKDKIELPKNVSPANSKGPYAIIGFGAIFVLVPILYGIGVYSATFSEGITKLFIYSLALLFVVVGVNVAIIKPRKRKKAMVDCYKVQGTLVDFITKRSKKDGHLYTPIYSFYYNGQDMHMTGNVSGNSSKYRQIGRRVTIVINTATGEKYCLEDMDTGRKIGFLFLSIGVILTVIFEGKDFFGLFGGSNNNISNASDNSINGSRFELNLNDDGYSNEAVTLPEDERFCEYYYVPANKDGTYSYNIKIYHYGIGVVTIFPNESNGKGIVQTYSFYLDKQDLELVVKDSKEYSFTDLAGNVVDAEDAKETMDHKYLYYYDGKEREGSGGYGVEASLFDSVAEHIEDCVPQNVWNAIESEIERYYE